MKPPEEPRRPYGSCDFIAEVPIRVVAPKGEIREVAAGDRVTVRFEEGRYVELIVQRPFKGAWPPFCDSCSARLTGPGAVVLAPPTATGLCRKLHLCVDCYRGMFRGLDP